MTTLLYDVETDGLLKAMTTIHCMVIFDVDAQTTHVFRRHNGTYPDRLKTLELRASKAIGPNDIHYATVETGPEDTIWQGVNMLEAAEAIGGHNIIGFDNKAVAKLFPNFNPPETLRDTLVMSRMSFPDISQQDAAMRARAVRINTPKEEIMPGYLSGSHSLEAWGYRFEKHKGDYKKLYERAGIDPWAAWSPEMEEYCIGDVEVTALLYRYIYRKNPPPDDTVKFEQDVADLLEVMSSNGFPFDIEGAKALAKQLDVDLEERTKEVCARYGFWYAPEKKWQVAPLWIDPAGANAAKTYKTPRPEFGEDYSRAVWADVTAPKINRVKHDINRFGPFSATYTKYDPEFPGTGAYCKIVAKEFNPGSRQHVIDRFTTVHGWVPTAFSETGIPTVDDVVLKTLKERIPEAADIAEILFLKKILGQVREGRKSWINSYDPDTKCIHPRTLSTGAVSGRCAHLDPNAGQIPAVMTDKAGDVLKGRAGEYGWECRQLWHVPEIIDGEEWVEVGVDLSGIELRCLGAVCLPERGGPAMLESILSGDPHSYNQEAAELSSRDTAKRALYCLMYGGGDRKLGMTCDPHGDELLKYLDPTDVNRTNEGLITADVLAAHHKRYGAAVRAKMMRGLPALDNAIKKVKAEAEAKKYLKGMDGRRLPSRSSHSALNLRLQSDAAVIAKRWLLLVEKYALEAGLDHGWNGDFVMLVFVHDEIQVAVKKKHAKLFSELAEKAAKDAGEFYQFGSPVAAKAKIGHNWAECH